MRAARVALLHLAEEVRAEQRIERDAALGRRRQSRMRGAADVGDGVRPEQADGRKERGGLLGRDRKTVRPQQRREADKGARCPWKDTHAAASAKMASSRPDM